MTRPDGSSALEAALEGTPARRPGAGRVWLRSSLLDLRHESRSAGCRPALVGRRPRAARALLDRLLLPPPGRVLGNLEVGHDAEVVAGPDAVHRPVEDPKAPG